MRRVLVIGSSGAGKSQFSLRLASKTNLPLTHLDELYWLPNWTHRYTPEEWDKVLSDLANAEMWILDGNYPKSLELRANRADHVVVLQYPRWLCLWRAITRAWLHRRPDSDVLEQETLDWEFLQIIWRFPGVGLREVERLRRFPNLNVIVLHNDAEADDFLNSLPQRPNGM